MADTPEIPDPKKAQENKLSASFVWTPESTVSKATTAGVTSAKPTYFFLERYMPAYQAEWQAFVTAIEAGTALPVTLQDGINALALAEAATLSAKTGQTIEITPSMLGPGRRGQPRLRPGHAG